jgi:hypothetical protein
MAEENGAGHGRGRCCHTGPRAELFVSKGLTGTGLAFVQSMLFMAVVGGCSTRQGY